MTNSRVQVAPVNLKERIAVFQQRHVSPDTRPVSPSLATPPVPNSAGLRDKIATFEKKGGIPVPRGSFGLGAPPLAENGPAKRRGELYGNRIPGPVRVSGGPPTSRSGSPFDNSRSFSPSVLDGDDSDMSPINAAPNLPSLPSSPSSPGSPFQSLSVDYEAKDSIPRSTAFVTALDIARQTEKGRESRKSETRGSSRSPPVLVAVTNSHKYEGEGEDIQESMPEIIVSSDEAPSSESSPVEVPLPIQPFASEVNPVLEASTFQEPLSDGGSHAPPNTSPSFLEVAPVQDTPLTKESASSTDALTSINVVLPPEVTQIQASLTEGSDSSGTNASTPRNIVSPLEVTQVQAPLTEGSNSNSMNTSTSINAVVSLKEPGQNEDTPLPQGPTSIEPLALNSPENQLVESSLMSTDILKEDDSAVIVPVEVVISEDATSSAQPHPQAESSAVAIKADDSPITIAVPSSLQANDQLTEAEATDPLQDTRPDDHPTVLLAGAEDILAAQQANISSEPTDNPNVATQPMPKSVTKLHPDDIDVTDHHVLREVPDKAVSPDGAQSPVGPFSLANAVFDLGQVVANIHDMFPGQISPLAAPPPYKPFHITPPAQDESSHSENDSGTNVKANKSKSNLIIRLNDTSPSVSEGNSHDKTDKPKSVPDTSQESTLESISTPPPSQFAFLNTPYLNSGRPMSMVESSPSHITFAHRMTPVTSRGVPVFVPANHQSDKQDFGHYPPTPDQDETEFGTVSLHKASHSFSHSRTYVAHTNSGDNNKASTFSAVVHSKITEVPGLTPPRSGSATVLETPQRNQTKRSVYGEMPTSPGFGELAVLLEEAALLERTLAQGELPSETVGQESEERQKAVEENTLPQPQVAGEEVKGNPTNLKTRSRLEPPAQKPKGPSRNPMLRSKSYRRDPTSDGQNPNPVRVKSTLLPFRPHQPTSHHQSVPVAPEEQVTPPTTDTETASQASPKSPRQYFAGLRRLASTSRSPTPSGTHPRHSVSTSSEMSEDSLTVPTPPGGLDPTGSGTRAGTPSESGHTSYWSSSGIAWPSLSPKKSPGIARAASFADKMWHRGRTKSNVSVNTAYETIDRITKSATKSAAALIPPLDPVAFSLEVPIAPNTDLPSPPEKLVSPRRSASLYVPSTSQFPPIYSAKPTSPVYTPHPVISSFKQEEDNAFLSLNSMFRAELTSPELPSPGYPPSLSLQPEDVLTPASSVGTPFLPSPALPSGMTFTESPTSESLMPENQNRPPSWVSVDSAASLIPSLVDSFPSVPKPIPTPASAPSRQKNFVRPSLPLPTTSFFEAAPLTSTAVGAEFLTSTYPRSATVRSATVPREHR